MNEITITPDSESTFTINSKTRLQEIIENLEELKGDFSGIKNCLQSESEIMRLNTIIEHSELDKEKNGGEVNYINIIAQISAFLVEIKNEREIQKAFEEAMEDGKAMVDSFGEYN